MIHCLISKISIYFEVAHLPSCILSIKQLGHYRVYLFRGSLVSIMSTFFKQLSYATIISTYFEAAPLLSSTYFEATRLQSYLRMLKKLGYSYVYLF